MEPSFFFESFNQGYLGTGYRLEQRTDNRCGDELGGRRLDNGVNSWCRQTGCAAELPKQA